MAPKDIWERCWFIVCLGITTVKNLQAKNYGRSQKFTFLDQVLFGHKLKVPFRPPVQLSFTPYLNSSIEKLQVVNK